METVTPIHPEQVDELFAAELAAMGAELEDAMEAISHLEALVSGNVLRAVNPVALATINIALALLSSADVALRTFSGLDISDEEQRARLAAEISDIILHGVIPRV